MGTSVLQTLVSSATAWWPAGYGRVCSCRLAGWITMLKAELEELIEEMKEVGDNLSELVEIFAEDPVIKEYMFRIEELSRPLFMGQLTKPYIIKNANDTRDKWDNLVGILQEAGLVDKELMAIGEEDTVYYD
jgi:hypothetical protein